MTTPPAPPNQLHPVEPLQPLQPGQPLHPGQPLQPLQPIQAAVATDRPDLVLYLTVHRALRESASQLARAIEAHGAADEPVPAALVRWYRGYADEVLTHHRIEDEILFPALAQRIDTYGEYAPTVTADHAELDVLLHGLTAALEEQDGATAASLARELSSHLDEHLGYEDDEIVPLFVRHFSEEAFAALNEQATRATPPRQLLFSAPWLMSMMTDDEQRTVLAAAPKAVHVLWILTRGRYRRLTARAFGTAT